VGAPRMLGSDPLFANYRREFVKNCTEWIARMGSGYDVLENYVLEESTAHLRWIKWAGFSLHERVEEFGCAPKPFSVRTSTSPRQTAADSVLVAPTNRSPMVLTNSGAYALIMWSTDITSFL
jgi:hypothetical protein